jgi:hypothetical protein
VPSVRSPRSLWPSRLGPTGPLHWSETATRCTEYSSPTLGTMVLRALAACYAAHPSEATEPCKAPCRPRPRSRAPLLQRRLRSIRQTDPSDTLRPPRRFRHRPTASPKGVRAACGARGGAARWRGLCRCTRSRHSRSLRRCTLVARRCASASPFAAAEPTRQRTRRSVLARTHSSIVRLSQSIAPVAATTSAGGLRTRHSQVCVQGAMDDWPAAQRWADVAYLRTVAGARIVPVEVGRHGSFLPVGLCSAGPAFRRRFALLGRR